MRLFRRSETARPLGDIFLAPRGRSQRYSWLVLAVAVVLEVLLILANYLADSTVHPLAPVGAGVVFISVLAAGVSGALVGLAAALAGVVAAFLLLADFGSANAAANAMVSAIIWCGAAVATGLVVGNLRGQVLRREAALEQSLRRSLSAKEQMERVLEFTPHFHQGENLAEVTQTVCDTAVETFGADGCRLYSLQGDSMDILAFAPTSDKVARGFSLTLGDFPDFDEMLAKHRPSFVRDVRETRVRGPALQLQTELHIVSTIRIPIASPDGAFGMLTLTWAHPIERPTDELMALMQRFADQAAIAWQNALRTEAQRQADALHETLERVVTLAPTFHIAGTSEQVGKAICEAAVVTFGCTGASLYRVEGDRLRVLDCSPPLESLPQGRTFPLDEEMPLVREIRSRAPTFIPDVSDPSRSMRPWPAEVVRQAGTRSALYVPLRFDERGPQNLLVLNWDRPRTQPDENFLVIVERFADQAALALSNASAQRLHARLEASLLPSTPIDHPRVQVVTRYRTGEQRLRLGGDFVGSTLAEDGGLDFVIGDVSGHGPDAAALGATLRSTWKALVLAGQSLPETVGVMREVLVAERKEASFFATILAGHIDVERSSVSFLNAGHVPPILITDQIVSLDSPPASPLGLDKGNSWELRRFRLPERWSLFCYTDGLIDARVAPGSSERYGEDRLKKRLGAWSSPQPDGAALDALMTEIETASGGHFADDVAVLLLSSKNGAEGAAT